MYLSGIPSVLAASPLAATPLVLQGLLATPLGKLLVALVAITVIVLVGRVVLSVAWKLLVVATLVVAGLWLVSTVLGGF
ncbi:hypothetical protein [Halobacterium bonnevillei]|uniref:Uncharacterized protein n=1 Tax=Halobacterium bonnevillei TaxID=2692200 RepID=A0A6B0SHU3_9EURY|nr:hypothetical protein [Halobacterium bonnevillei]MXR21344.1 hypothetical protein [Halobacterium bonnevillei]